MSLSIFHYCIITFLCHCCRFNPSLCCLLPFHLSYVTVSRQCRLWEFYPNRASLVLSVMQATLLGMFFESNSAPKIPMDNINLSVKV